MAWIEQRREQHRVYWSNRPGTRPRRDYEAFTCHADAEAFLELIGALGDPLAARAFVRRDQLDADPCPTGQAPALRLDRLRNVYLAPSPRSIRRPATGTPS